MVKKIGVIGLGIMGHGMAVNFLKAGHELAVWNRTPKKADNLVALGASLLSSPKKVTEFADIVFDVVSDDDASRGVWFGDDGIFAGATSEKILITSATLSIDFVQELILSAERANYSFLDMPLTGSRAGAEKGTLKLLVGGDVAVLNSIRSELGAISQKIYYFGEAGNGMRFKLILNALGAIHGIAASQAAVLSESVGLNPVVVKDAIMDGMGPSSPFTNFGFDNFTIPQVQTRFAINMLEKDLRYAQKMAKDAGIDINMLDIAQNDFSEAIQKGLGGQDWTSVLELYRKPAKK